MEVTEVIKHLRCTSSVHKRIKALAAQDGSTIDEYLKKLADKEEAKKK